MSHLQMAVFQMVITVASGQTLTTMIMWSPMRLGCMTILTHDFRIYFGSLIFLIFS